MTPDGDIMKIIELGQLVAELRTTVKMQEKMLADKDAEIQRLHSVLVDRLKQPKDA